MKKIYFLKKYIVIFIILIAAIFYGEKHFARGDFTYAIASTPQNAFDFVDKKNQNNLLIDRLKASQLAKNYLSHYFYPWKIRRDYPFLYIKKAVIDNYHYYLFHPGYGINHLKNSSLWLKAVFRNTDMSHFPNAFIHAITVQNTNIRVLPTNQPIFDSFKKAGQGYPFDDLETTSLAANTPVLILQTSTDKAWSYILTNNSDGWVPSAVLASVDKHFIKQFETGQYAALTQNNVTMVDENHVFQFTVGIGKIVPVLSSDSKHVTILIAVSDAEHHAVLKKALISKDKIKPWPISLTQFHLATIMNAMLGTKYAWGGMNDDSDCSLTTMNLFAPFGIWLPRHSSLQAGMGEQFDLRHYSDSEKKKMILKKGVPFLTLLYMPGHIQTYLGEKNGVMYVFQTVWGVHSENIFLQSARAKIGKTVISPVDLGAFDINVKETWLERIHKMAKL